MKNLLLLLAVTLACGLHAQQSDVGPIVFSKTRAATYASCADLKIMPVRLGEVLNPDGIIEIARWGSVGLIYKGTYTYINGPGTFSLATELAGDNLQSSQAVTQLSAQLIDAIDPAFRGSSAGLGGDRPSGTRPPGPGHGNRDAKIQPVLPYSGRLYLDTITFSWKLAEGESASSEYTLAVMTEDEEVIQSVSVAGNTHRLTASSLGLKPGKKYLWKVTAQDRPGVNSGILQFEFADRRVAENIRKSLLDDKAYAQASPAARILLEATTMENTEFFTEAHDLLRAASKEYDKDPLLDWMYRLLVWRLDQ